MGLFSDDDVNVLKGVASTGLSKLSNGLSKLSLDDMKDKAADKLSKLKLDGIKDKAANSLSNLSKTLDNSRTDNCGLSQLSDALGKVEMNTSTDGLEEKIKIYTKDEIVTYIEESRRENKTFIMACLGFGKFSTMQIYGQMPLFYATIQKEFEVEPDEFIEVILDPSTAYDELKKIPLESTEELEQLEKMKNWEEEEEEKIDGVIIVYDSDTSKLTFQHVYDNIVYRAIVERNGDLLKYGF